MTIASDRWIRAQCVGELHYELYYDDTFKGVFPIDLFTRDTVVDKAVLLALQPGEEASFGGSGSMIRVKCVETLPPGFQPLIAPFTESSIKHLDIADELYAALGVKCPSYGSSSFGYDIRVDRKFSRLKKVEGRFVDTADTPMGLKPSEYIDSVEADYIDVEPGQAILAVSMERVSMPPNATATCMAKSTLARLFLDATVTPIEAGWSGYITLEIFNKSPNTIRLRAGIGIMQLIFHVSEQRCLVSYADRGGKYQDQPNEPVAGAF